MSLVVGLVSQADQGMCLSRPQPQLCRSRLHLLFRCLISVAVCPLPRGWPLGISVSVTGESHAARCTSQPGIRRTAIIPVLAALHSQIPGLLMSVTDQSVMQCDVLPFRKLVLISSSILTTICESSAGLNSSCLSKESSPFSNAFV